MNKTKDDIRKALREWATIALVLLVLDLFWLGSFARDFYAHHLGSLLAPQANRLAAGLFYLFYVTVTWGFAVRGSTSTRQSGTKGAALGFVSYGVYELTNWAVIQNWPVILVPVDWTWGIILTATAAAAGRLASVPKKGTHRS